VSIVRAIVNRVRRFLCALSLVQTAHRHVDGHRRHGPERVDASPNDAGEMYEARKTTVLIRHTLIDPLGAVHDLGRFSRERDSSRG